MLTFIANAEIDGEPVDWDLKLGYIRLLIIAGIDTTWSAIGSGLWHFAQHPDEVDRLVAVGDDDLLWQTAIGGGAALLRAGDDGPQGDRRDRDRAAARCIPATRCC